MVHQSNARGSLVLDKRYRGIGRLKRATGTRDEKQFGLYVAMCDAFYAAGAEAWLKALMRGPGKGGIGFAEAWTLYKPTNGRVLDINRLPSPETARRLWAEDEAGAETGALAQWMAGRDVSKASKENADRDARALRRVAKPTATVADLPDLVKRFRDACLKRETQTRVQFNHVRSTALTFLRDTVGDRHQLYFGVKDVKPLAVTRAPTSGLTAREVRAVCAALASHVGQRRHGAPMGPACAAAFWALCTTGMRPAEFWAEAPARWELLEDRVRVWASKTGRGVLHRDIPCVDRAAVARPPVVTREGFEGRLLHLTNGTAMYAKQGAWPKRLTPYTGRRTFRHACEMAGIPDSRAKVYRARGPSSVDELYKQMAVDAAYLAADTEKLREWFGVGEQHPGPQLVRESA
jgi:hypothetical protein